MFHITHIQEHGVDLFELFEKQNGMWYRLSIANKYRWRNLEMLLKKDLRRFDMSRREWMWSTSVYSSDQFPKIEDVRKVIPDLMI